MHDLTPITPLGGQTARVDTHGPVTLEEVVSIALAGFAARLGQENPAQKVLEDFISAKAPGPGQATFGDISAFWMGPDLWMVMAPFDSHEDLATQLKAKAKTSASTTEQTDGWCRFDLKGDGLSDVFERLCPVNFRSWTGGEATRTTIDHLGCFLLCYSRSHAVVLGPRSSAGSLHHALLTAIKSAH